MHYPTGLHCHSRNSKSVNGISCKQTEILVSLACVFVYVYHSVQHTLHWIIIIYVIVIPRYEYDIVVITRVRGEAEYEC